MEKKRAQTELVVIDTSIFIDFLREYPPAADFFRNHSGSYEGILFSYITQVELLSGTSCNNGEARSKVVQMLNNLKGIEINSQIASLAGDLRRKTHIDIPDAIIAATALFHKAELLTKNIKDFNNVPGLNVRDPY